MLSPNKTKFRKLHRKVLRHTASSRGNYFAFGDYAIVAVGSGFINSRQIESGRIAINRHMKRVGKLWIRIFPDVPYTKKPVGVRMGGGKGSVEYWHCPISPGRILFEVSGVNKEIAHRALDLARAKLSVKTKFVTREEIES